MGPESHEQTPYAKDDPALNHQIYRDPTLLLRAWEELVDESPDIAASIRTTANSISQHNPAIKQGFLLAIAYERLSDKREKIARDLEKLLEGEAQEPSS